MLPQFRVNAETTEKPDHGRGLFRAGLGREPRVARRDTANAHFK
jgi:hypothetical protein